MEQWRPVVGFPTYEVSDRGRVRGPGRGDGHCILRPRPARGYPRARLPGGIDVPVHVLVLEAFVGPRPPGFHCNHRDGDKANNCVSNLEWVTPADNTRHAFATGLNSGDSRRGERNGRAKLTPAYVQAIRGAVGTNVAIARVFGISNQQVSNIRRGRAWAHLGRAD